MTKFLIKVLKPRQTLIAQLLRFALPISITFISAMGSAASTPEWIVKVSSTYKDESAGGSQRKYTFAGTGTLVKIEIENKDRVFVLTAAHLTQGEDLTVTAFDGQNVPLKMGGLRAFDAYSDIDLFEVDTELPAIFAWNPQQFAFATEPGNFNTDGWINLVHNKSLYPTYIFKPTWACASVLPNAPPAYVLGRANAFPHEEFNGVVYANYSDSEMIASTRISPGMSGGPLINNYDKRHSGLFQIKGTAKKLSVVFENSYFSTASQIERVVNSLEATPSTNSLDQDFKWVVKQGHLTLQSTSDPKTYFLAFDAVGRGVIGEGGSKKDLCDLLSPPYSTQMDRLNPYESLQVKPGITVSDHNVIGYKVAIPNSFDDDDNIRKFTYLATQGSFKHINDSNFYESVESVILDNNFGLDTLLKERMSFQPYSQMTSICTVKIDSDNYILTLAGDNKRGVYTGALKPGKNWNPIINIDLKKDDAHWDTNKVEEQLVIDTTGLFFIDIDQIPKHHPDVYNPEDMLSHYIRRPSISIKGNLEKRDVEFGCKITQKNQ